MGVKDSLSACLSLKLIYSETESENEELLKDKSRSWKSVFSDQFSKWYVLALYCLISFCQVAVWNTWSPIASSALFAFPSWSESTIALLNNWSSITCLIFVAPCCWLLKEKGLRVSFILASFLCVIGCGVRLFKTDEQFFTLYAHFGSILNAIGGVIISPAIVQLSSTWFPPNQRTFATGVAGSYVIGPLVVREPDDYENEQIFVVRKLIRREITLLLVIGFVVEFLIFSFVCCTFPDKPTIPPSKSSTLRMVQNKSFFKSVKTTLSFQVNESWVDPGYRGFTFIIRPSTSILPSSCNLEFWKLSFASGLCNGITGPWLSLLTIILANTGITQSETAKLGFWSVVCGWLMGLTVGKFSDYKPGNLRGILISLISFSNFMFMWILLFTSETIEFSRGGFALSVIGALSILWATPALYYELAAEINYPISEEIVASCMMAVNNFCTCLVYLQIYIFPSLNVNWMNYGLVIFGLISLMLLIISKPEYKRLYVDLS